MFFIEIDVFDASAGRDDELLGGLGDVAAVMKPVGSFGNIGSESFFDFAGARVASGELAALSARGGARVPDEAAGHDEIFW